MEVKIENIRDDHINQLEEVADKIITIDLNGVRYLSSYIITRYYIEKYLTIKNYVVK